MFVCSGNPLGRDSWKYQDNSLLWEEFMMLEGDTNPLLAPSNRTHILPPRHDPEEVTMEQFKKLKVSD